MNKYQIIIIIMIALIITPLIIILIRSLFEKNSLANTDPKMSKKALNNHMPATINNNNAKESSKALNDQISATIKKDVARMENVLRNELKIINDNSVKNYTLDLVKQIRELSRHFNSNFNISSQLDETNNNLNSRIKESEVNVQRLSDKLEGIIEVQNNLVQRMEDIEIKSIDSEADSLNERNNKWISSLEKLNIDKQNVDILATIAKALEIIDRNKDGYLHLFTDLSVQLGFYFYRSANGLDQNKMNALQNDIHTWIDNNDFPVKYIFPKIKEGFDSTMHMVIDGRTPNSNDTNIISKVACWGILQNKVNGSVIRPAIVHID